MAIPAAGHGRIFLSYRRDDTRHLAGRLYDRFVERFGPAHIFMDVDSIEPGADFGAAIDKAVASCDVLLALIGPTWLGAEDEEGNRRLDDPDDFVVLEITAALRRNVRVLPVLVDGTPPPRGKDLPEALLPLARRNAVRLDHETFRSDLEALLAAVTKVVSRGPADAAPSDRRTVGRPPSGVPGGAGRHSAEAADVPSADRPSDAPARGHAPPEVSGTDPRLSTPSPGSRGATGPHELLAEHYELGEALSRGSTSVLRRAVDIRSGRDVMVKVIPTELARDPQFPVRFRQVMNAAVIHHPAVVATYDVGTVSGEPGPLLYVAMEYVDGRNLREMLKTFGPVPQERAIEVMLDVCAALDVGHRHGVVHRDLKPTNIVIDKAGRAKVMGFGVATALNEAKHVTQTATMVGTAHYLSPEQSRGDDADVRSDIYAAGCVLFTMLTGEPPFSGNSRVAVAYQHVHEDPRPPSVLNRHISSSLDSVVLRALSKNPANRYQTADEMRADLLRVRSGRPPVAPLVLSVDDRPTWTGPGTSGPPPSAGPTRPVGSPLPTRRLGLVGVVSGGRNRRVMVGLAVVVVLGLVAYLVYGGSPR